IDVLELDNSNSWHLIQSIAGMQCHDPIDLESGSPFRALLVHTSEQEHTLMILAHHIVGDGSSVAIFWRELSEIYSAILNSRRADLPELPLQYADYAVFERSCKPVRIDGINYWGKQLNDLPDLHLANDYPRRMY